MLGLSLGGVDDCLQGPGSPFPWSAKDSCWVLGELTWGPGSQASWECGHLASQPAIRWGLQSPHQQHRKLGRGVV